MSGQLHFEGFAPELNPELSQYHTPMKLCRKIANWAGPLEGLRVIEPSAGGGNLVVALKELGAKVSPVEIDPRWVEAMRVNFGIHAVCEDFLKMEPPAHTEGHTFHLAVMNPPLDKGVGPTHIAHALKWAPRVVSVLRGEDLNGVNRFKKLWSKCDHARDAHCVRRPIYSGTGGEMETVVVDVYRDGTYHGPQSIEHWAESWK